MRQARLLLVVNLDDAPGTMGSPESAMEVAQNILYQRMGAYKPRVSLAPAPLYDPADIPNEGTN